MPGVEVTPGFDVERTSDGTPAELLPSMIDRYRTRARSSNVGIWIPGVVTAEVGAVEKPRENSRVRAEPSDGVLRDAVEFREMHEMEPLQLPL